MSLAPLGPPAPAGALPLVFVPGHLCGAWLYAPQVAHLGGRHPVLLADVTRDDSLGAMAERLLAEAPERFLIAGLSMGGMVAMEAMVRAPERVAGALLLDTDPTAARPKEREWRGALAARVRAEGLAAYAEVFVPKFFAHLAPEAAEAWTARILPRMAETDPEVFARQAAALDGRRDLLAMLAGCGMPVEVAVGAEDRVCPPLLHERLAAALPGARLTLIPGTGHLATLEAAEAVGALLDRLVARAG